eukprot:scaffold27137_cov121-Isochrysis_galbana.AAC.9
MYALLCAMLRMYVLLPCSALRSWSCAASARPSLHAECRVESLRAALRRSAATCSERHDNRAEREEREGGDISNSNLTRLASSLSEL